MLDNSKAKLSGHLGRSIIAGSTGDGLGQVHLSDLSIKRKTVQERKRGQYFVRGPLKFEFINNVIPDPTSRVVLIAIAFMDMGGSNKCVLSSKVWMCAGIHTTDLRRRVLKRLRACSPTLEVIDRKGRSSMLVLGDAVER